MPAARTRPAKPVVVHVNQHVIRHNTKHGTDHPCMTVKHPSLGTVYCHAVRGYCRSVDARHERRRPLSCGARLWLEYTAESFEFVEPPLPWRAVRAAMKRDGADGAVCA